MFALNASEQQMGAHLWIFYLEEVNMPIFSQSSLDKLKTCHPELQVLFYEVIRHRDCTIIEGHRTKAAQDAAFARGASKVKYPHGKHNAVPSIAVDVAPYPLPQWQHGEDFYYFGGFVMGIAAMLKAQGIMRHAVRYGSDWNRNMRISDEGFVDAVHFELEA